MHVKLLDIETIGFCISRMEMGVIAAQLSCGKAQMIKVIQRRCSRCRDNGFYRLMAHRVGDSLRFYPCGVARLARR